MTSTCHLHQCNLAYDEIFRAKVDKGDIKVIAIAGKAHSMTHAYYNCRNTGHCIFI